MSWPIPCIIQNEWISSDADNVLQLKSQGNGTADNLKPLGYWLKIKCLVIKRIIHTDEYFVRAELNCITFVDGDQGHGFIFDDVADFVIAGLVELKIHALNFELTWRTLDGAEADAAVFVSQLDH